KQRALRFLSQYVVRVPSDTQTMARLGFLLDEPGQSPAERWRARRAFEQVLIRDKDRNDVRRRLALLDVALGDTDAARPHLTALLEITPDDAEILANFARCVEAKQQFKDAATFYENSIKADKSRLASYLRLASIQRDSLHDPDEADGWIDEMVWVNE